MAWLRSFQGSRIATRLLFIFSFFFMVEGKHCTWVNNACYACLSTFQFNHWQQSGENRSLKALEILGAKSVETLCFVVLINWQTYILVGCHCSYQGLYGTGGGILPTMMAQEESQFMEKSLMMRILNYW